jgi:sugar-specific transcriptional regulator TrmB
MSNDSKDSVAALVMKMLNCAEEIKTLSQLGLTSCQARVYLVLAHSGKSSAKTIARTSKIAKPDVYRVIAALHEIGLVEKTLGTPTLFSVIPIEQSLEILFRRQEAQHKDREKNAKKLLDSLRNSCIEESVNENEDYFILLPPKTATIERRRKLINTAQESVDIMSSLKKLRRGIYEYQGDMVCALKKGVKFRIITEKPEDVKTLVAQMTDLSNHGSFEKKANLNVSALASL